MARPVNGGPSEVDRVRSLREVLTATGAGIYLATHVAGPIPAETMAAVHESDDMELRVGRVGPDRADDLEQREKEARAVVAAVIKASPERVILAHGVPEAARSVALTVLGARPPGQDQPRVLVISGLPDPVVAAVTEVAVACGARVDELGEAPRILSAEVALVLMAHVDVDGRRADVAPVAEAARKAGARLLVDASCSVGALPVEVASLGADALLAGAHRWLLGPEAVALAWLSPELGDDVPAQLRTSSGPFSRGALLGLARSVGWLLMYVELPWLLTRTADLSSRLSDGLDASPGVETVGEGPLGAHVTFRIAGWDASQAAEELSRSVFAILEADGERDVLRASVGAWNREDELDRFVQRVAELAAHTPETLPRRPSLTILRGPLDREDDV